MLKPEEIKIGNQYQYEEKYYFACTVTVLENQCKNDWIGYKLQIDKIIGDARILGEKRKIGETFTCGYLKGLRHYIDWKIKPVGSMTDYMFK